MAGDWLKLHRCIVDSEVFQDDWLCRLWIWCLCKANFKPMKFRGTEIPRGSFVTGRFIGAEALGVSPSRFYRGLDRLKALKCIDVKPDRSFSVVTVCNYDTYQDQPEISEHQANTSADTRANTSADSQRTQARTQEKEGKNSRREEFKNERREEQEKTPLPPAGGGDVDFENFWLSFPKLRRQKKRKAAAAYGRAVDRVAKANSITRSEAVAFIQEAVAEFAMSPRGRGRYCPGPEPWLNGDSWEDDREAWKYESLDDLPRSKSCPADPRGNLAAGQSYLNRMNGVTADAV